jgi:hypothetical protein
MMLAGKTAMVTAAGGGIGRGISVALARAGAVLIVTDIVEDKLVETHRIIKENGGTAFPIPADVTDETAVRWLIKESQRSVSTIDVLVNVAGGVIEGTVATHTIQEWRKVLDLNLTSTFLVSHHVVPIMVSKGSGIILNISSEVGLKGFKGRCAYTAAKTGLIGLTRSMAVDLAPFKIRVNAICPGTILTPGIKNLIACSPDPEGKIREFTSRRLTDYLGEQEDIGELVVFLSSSKATYFNGAIISVDGGSTC